MGDGPKQDIGTNSYYDDLLEKTRKPEYGENLYEVGQYLKRLIEPEISLYQQGGLLCSPPGDVEYSLPIILDPIHAQEVEAGLNEHLEVIRDHKSQNLKLVAIHKNNPKTQIRFSSTTEGIQTGHWYAQITVDDIHLPFEIRPNLDQTSYRAVYSKLDAREKSIEWDNLKKVLLTSGNDRISDEDAISVIEQHRKLNITQQNIALSYIHGNPTRLLNTLESDEWDIEPMNRLFSESEMIPWFEQAKRMMNRKTILPDGTSYAGHFDQNGNIFFEVDNSIHYPIKITDPDNGDQAWTICKTGVPADGDAYVLFSGPADDLRNINQLH